MAGVIRGHRQILSAESSAKNNAGEQGQKCGGKHFHSHRWNRGHSFPPSRRTLSTEGGKSPGVCAARRDAGAPHACHCTPSRPRPGQLARPRRSAETCAGMGTADGRKRTAKAAGHPDGARREFPPASHHPHHPVTRLRHTWKQEAQNSTRGAVGWAALYVWTQAAGHRGPSTALSEGTVTFYVFSRGGVGLFKKKKNQQKIMKRTLQSSLNRKVRVGNRRTRRATMAPREG